MKKQIVRIKYKAFTLIEVLIVVLIVAILAAIVVAHYIDIIDDSEESAVRTQLQVLRTEIGRYLFYENEYPPDLDTLHTAEYISSPPEHPGEGEWVYDAETGELLSSVDENW